MLYSLAQFLRSTIFPRTFCHTSILYFSRHCVPSYTQFFHLSKLYFIVDIDYLLLSLVFIVFIQVSFFFVLLFFFFFFFIISILSFSSLLDPFRLFNIIHIASLVWWSSFSVKSAHLSLSQLFKTFIAQQKKLNIICILRIFTILSWYILC